MRFVIAGGGIAAMAAVERLLQLVEEEMERGGGGGADGGLLPLSVVVLSPSPTLHFASHVQRRSAGRLSFDVGSAPSSSLFEQLSRRYGGHVRLSFVEGRLSALDADKREVGWKEVSGGGGGILPFDRLLLAVGARPSQPFTGDRVCVVRDAESILDLHHRLQRLRVGEAGKEGGVIVVVGNGGLALEVIQALSVSSAAAELPRVVWALKDGWLGATFLDPTSSAFLLPRLFPVSDPPLDSRSYDEEEGRRMKTGRAEWERRKALREGVRGHEGRLSPPSYGGALGPHWQRHLQWGPVQDSPSSSASSQPLSSAPRTSASPLPPLLHFNCLVSQCEPCSPTADGGDGPPLLRVRLSNGVVYECALLLSCTGVVPNTEALLQSPIALHPEDGGVVVGPSLRSSLPRVYAAGDCASLSVPSSPHFLQMRLWSQAIVAGTNAATAMWEDASQAAADPNDEQWEEEEGDEEEGGRFFYGPFFHETRLLGERVLLMGLFNERQAAWKREERHRWREERKARNAKEDEEDEEEDDECRVLMRVTPHSSTAAAEERGAYVKALMCGGRVAGCTLIGDTGLEEVMENLITNQLDISMLGDEWLHADVDLQDFFD